MNERQKEAIEYTKQKGKITNKEYRELYKVSNKTAYQEIKALIELGLLEKKRGGKYIYYCYTDSGNAR